MCDLIRTYPGFSAFLILMITWMTFETIQMWIARKDRDK